jgi:hypothetical protein
VLELKVSKEKVAEMKALIWNSEGLWDTSKHLFIKLAQ